MAYTAQDLAAIVALSTGARSTEVRFADRVVKYQEIDIKELRKLRADVAGQLTPQRVPFAGRTWLCLEGSKGL